MFRKEDVAGRAKTDLLDVCRPEDSNDVQCESSSDNRTDNHQSSGNFRDSSS